MFKIFKYFPFFSIIFVLGLTLVNGCDDAGIEQPTNNANVVSYDSIYVEEDSTGGLMLSSVNLFSGTTLQRISNERDIDLNGDSTGTNFFLQSGFFETKFFLVTGGAPVSAFDTLKTVAGGTLDSADFTNWTTDTWGFLTAPSVIADPHPIYCFWLKGRRDAGQNGGVSIFGVMQPREATDSTPGVKGGFKMSLRVRINKNGENDFSETVQ